MTQLLTDATTLLPETATEVSLPEGVAAGSIRTSSRPALASAVATLISALSRHTTDRAVEVTGQASDHGVTLMMAPRGRSWSDVTTSSAAGQEFLAQGGLNLSLVLASQVLRSHGGSFEATDERPPALAVHFALPRGPK